MLDDAPTLLLVALIAGVAVVGFGYAALTAIRRWMEEDPPKPGGQRADQD